MYLRLVCVLSLACGLIGCGDHFTTFGPGDEGGGGDGTTTTSDGGTAGMGPGSGGSPGGGGHGGEASDPCDPVAPSCDGICALGICEQNLLAYLPFDEGDGGITVERVSGDPAAVVGALWAPGRHDGALSFATGDQVDAGALLNDLSMPFTLSAWIYVGAPPSASEPIVLTDNDQSGDAAGAWLTLHPENGNRLSVGFGSGVGGIATTSYRDKQSLGTVPQGWVHVAGVVVSHLDMRVYIGGIDAGGNYSGSATAIGSTGGALRVGSGRWGTTDSQYYGSVDDVRVYGRALSGTEIAELAAR